MVGTVDIGHRATEFGLLTSDLRVWVKVRPVETMGMGQTQKL